MLIKLVAYTLQINFKKEKEKRKFKYMMSNNAYIVPTWFLCDMSALHPEFQMTDPVGNGLDLL